MEKVSILNKTVSVHMIGPIEVGGEQYVLPPGVPVSVPLEFLEKFDGSVVLAHKFKSGELEFLNKAQESSALEEAKNLTEILTASGATIEGGSPASAPAP
jgi:hypothetical protein